jgi:hypothetical protein
MSIEIPKYIKGETRKKLSEVACKVEVLLPETVQETFVSTRFSQGSLVHSGVWLFSESLIVEIRDPMSSNKTQFEIGRIRKDVDWIRLTARNFNLGENPENAENPGSKAELDLEFTTRNGLSYEITANGKGCSDLFRLYRERFISNWADEIGDEEER